MCRDILNSCVRNTEAAQAGSGLGKGVWGMIEDSELAKTIKLDAEFDKQVSNIRSPPFPLLCLCTTLRGLDVACVHFRYSPLFSHISSVYLCPKSIGPRTVSCSLFFILLGSCFSASHLY